VDKYVTGENGGGGGGDVVFGEFCDRSHWKLRRFLRDAAVLVAGDILIKTNFVG
jgi:hypothetical protein